MAVPVDLDAFDVLTFDCYGTLIDWETGLLAALRDALPGADVGDDELLENYAGHEAQAERPPYRSYREVLATGVRGVAANLGLEVDDEAVARFSQCVRDWPAFPDSAEALGRLHERYRLGVITNCDDDLFAASQRKLGVEFDYLVTAQQAKRYKPNPRGFELMFERVGLPPARILHVAQSLFHDHVPAKRLGLSSVWVNRRAGKPGSGATPPAEATPDLVVTDMATLASVASA